MTRLLYDTTTTTLQPYPRDDDGPVIGLDSRYLEMVVIQQPQPSYDPATEQLTATEAIDTDACTVTRGWTITPLPPSPPQPRWVEFGTALGADPTVNQFVASLAQSAPVLHLMVGVGMGQAAQGDSQTFLAAWAMGLSQGLISTELAEHVAAIAAEHDLPAAFIAALVPTDGNLR
jgi:hypothetical protein